MVTEALISIGIILIVYVAFITYLVISYDLKSKFISFIKK
jgi:hypothetical protein